jgi:hypothetical protein
MNGSTEPARPERPTLIPSPSPIATGEGSRKLGVRPGQGVWKSASAPACHVLFMPWRWPVRVILPCDCGNARVERE